MDKMQYRDCGVYRRNHGLRQGTCSVKAARDLIQKFEETGCSSNWPRSEGPSVPKKTVGEIHQLISSVRPPSACGISCVLHLPNSTVSKILCSILNMFPFPFHSVQMLEARANHLRLDFANKFLILYDEDISWPLHILWTDEAHFTWIGNVNSKNWVHCMGMMYF